MMIGVTTAWRYIKWIFGFEGQTMFEFFFLIFVVRSLYYNNDLLNSVSSLRITWKIWNSQTFNSGW